MKNSIGLSTVSFYSNIFWQFLMALITFKYKSGVELFKKEIAWYFKIGTERIFLFGSGRMGLYSVLKCLNLKPTDEVIVTGYTCVVVPNAVKYSGAKIKYVDIDLATLNFDTHKLIKSISTETKAIVVAHNFGIVYEDINLIKEKFPHVFIIEDAAHTFSSLDKSGKKAGLIADASFFSFEYSKPISTGIGGSLIINDDDLKAKLISFYASLSYFPAIYNFKILVTVFTHYFTSRPFLAPFKRLMFSVIRRLGLIYSTSEAEQEGQLPKYYPVKLSPALAYLGYLQIKAIESTNKIKSAVVANYYNSLRSVNGIFLYYKQEHNYVRFPVVFKNEISATAIEKIKKEITLKTGIEIGVWFNDVVHPKGSFRYGYSDGICPVGEFVSRNIINLPVSIISQPDENQLDLIRDIIKVNIDKSEKA